MAQCEPYLQRQIELIQPQADRRAGQGRGGQPARARGHVASLRGKVHEYRGMPLIVTYHPAYLLRSLPDKAKAWEDLCFAVETMRGLQSAAAAAT